MRLDWMVLPVLYQKGIFLDPFKTKRGPMDDRAYPFCWLRSELYSQVRL
jgi:hypothetical protein